MSELRETDATLLPHDPAGEPLCVLWVNTVSWRGKPSPSEYLPDVDAWLRWSLEEGAIGEREFSWLGALSADSRDSAEEGFRAAIEAREATYRLLLAKARSQTPSESDAARFRDLVERALADVSIGLSEGRWSMELSRDSVDWDTPTHPCVLSAARLLLSPEAERLRACERPECAWIFLDTTKNRSRKWCDMGTCGNVVKARRSYARKRAKLAI